MDNMNNNMNGNMNYNAPAPKNGSSGLGIAAFILSLLGCTSFIGLILAIIDMASKNGKKKTFSIIALVLNGVWLLIGIAVFASGGTKNLTETKKGSSHVAETEKSGDDKKPDASSTDDADSNDDSASKDESSGDSDNSGPLSVGDTYTKSDFSITYAEFGEYKDYEDWAAPKEGNKIAYAIFNAVNNGDSDSYLSFSDFEGYANGTNVEKYFSIDSETSVNLSKGRVGTVTVAFEIPADCAMSEFEIEYTPNMWLDEKIIFVGSGDGTPVVADKSMVDITADIDSEVINEGETYDDKDVKIEYVECGELTDYDEWNDPGEGNKIIYAKFNVVNESDSDFTLAYWDFECFADNKQVEATYPGDEYSFTIDLSKGRNGKGSVAFVVPKDASDIQIEYSPSLWSSKHIIFQYKE